MKYLITGSAGFVGSNLVELLLQNPENEVVGIDNLSNGRMENVNDFLGDGTKYRFVEGDILNDFDLATTLGGFGNFDIVIHLAARGSVPASFENPSETYLQNIVGTSKVLQFAKMCKAKRFLNASSSSVYGRIRNIRACESDNPAPLSPYGASKSMAEEIVLAESGAMEFCNMRFFNVYGPRQKYIQKGAVVPAIVHAIKHGRTFLADNNGFQERDFTYVKDVCRTILALSRTNGAVPKAMNICTGSNRKVIDMWHIFNGQLAACGLKAIGGLVMPIQGKRKGDVCYSCGCADLRRKMFNLEFMSPEEAAADWFPEK